MRESEHFIITQRDGMWIIFFLTGLRSKGLKRKMAIQRKANTKEKEEIASRIQCWYHYILLMLVSSLLTWENEIIWNIPILCCFHFTMRAMNQIYHAAGKEPT